MQHSGNEEHSNISKHAYIHTLQQQQSGWTWYTPYTGDILLLINHHHVTGNLNPIEDNSLRWTQIRTLQLPPQVQRTRGTSSHPQILYSQIFSIKWSTSYQMRTAVPLCTCWTRWNHHRTTISSRSWTRRWPSMPYRNHWCCASQRSKVRPHQRYQCRGHRQPIRQR